jgi:hypothetical protein
MSLEKVIATSEGATSIVAPSAGVVDNTTGYGPAVAAPVQPSIDTNSATAAHLMTRLVTRSIGYVLNTKAFWHTVGLWHIGLSSNECAIGVV